MKKILNEYNSSQNMVDVYFKKTTRSKQLSHNGKIIRAKKNINIVVLVLDIGQEFVLYWDNEKNRYQADILGMKIWCNFDFDHDFSIETQQRQTQTRATRSRSGRPDRLKDT